MKFCDYKIEISEIIEFEEKKSPKNAFTIYKCY